MTNWKKPQGYADGGEIREGRNENIDDDTRSRAMAMIERVNKGKDAEPAKAMPRRNATRKDPDTREASVDTGDESGRLARRKPANHENDPSIPGPEPVKTGRTATRAERLMDEAKDNAGKMLDGLGPMAVAAGVGLKAANSARRAVTRAAGRDVMEAAGRRAGEMRDRMAGLREGRERAQEAAKARESARDAAEARRRAPRDVDEERMSGEGGAFAQGGLVGHGDFNYGKKR